MNFYLGFFLILEVLLCFVNFNAIIIIFLIICLIYYDVCLIGLSVLVYVYACGTLIMID